MFTLLPRLSFYIVLTIGLTIGMIAWWVSSSLISALIQTTIALGLVGTILWVINMVMINATLKTQQSDPLESEDTAAPATSETENSDSENRSEGAFEKKKKTGFLTECDI